MYFSSKTAGQKRKRLSQRGSKKNERGATRSRLRSRRSRRIQATELSHVPGPLPYLGITDSGHEEPQGDKHHGDAGFARWPTIGLSQASGYDFLVMLITASTVDYEINEDTKEIVFAGGGQPANRKPEPKQFQER